MPQKLFEQFIQFKADNTQRAYRCALDDFLSSSVIGRRFDVAKVKPRHVLIYLEALKARELADGTVRLRMTLLQALWSFYQAVGLANSNPFQVVKKSVPLRESKTRPTAAVDLALVSKIINTPDPRTLAGKRDRALLAVMFGCGLRRSELLRLELESIKIDKVNHLLFFELGRCKSGRKERQPIPSWVAEYLTVHVAALKGRNGGQNCALWLNYFERTPDRPLAEHTLYKKFRGYCEIHGITASPHAARAAFATALLESGVPYEEVARALRHKTIKQVQAYDKRRKTLSNNAGVNVSYQKNSKD